MGGAGGDGDAGVGFPGAVVAEDDFGFAAGGECEGDEGDAVDRVFGELVELIDGFGGFVADAAFGGERDAAKEKRLSLEGECEEKNEQAHGNSSRLRIR